MEKMPDKVDLGHDLSVVVEEPYIRIELTKGYYAIISPEDADYLTRWSWHTSTKPGSLPFGRRNVRKKEGRKTSALYLHKEVARLMDMDPELRIGHKDLCGLNNLRSNILYVPYGYRSGHHGGRRKNIVKADPEYRASTFTGERFITCNRHGKMVVRIKDAETRITYKIGEFDELPLAVAARNQALASSDLSIYPTINTGLGGK